MRNIVFNGEEIYVSKVVCIGRNYVEHIAELQNEIPSEPVITLINEATISWATVTMNKITRI